MHKKRPILTIVFLLVTAACAYSQGSIYGVVSDSTGQPVELASIAIANSGEGTISDTTGFFELAVPSNTPVKLVVSCTILCN